MKMTFRWFGDEDPVTLDKIRQIPGMTGVVTALYDTPVGEVWSQESIDSLKKEINDKGLEMEVIESVPVHEDIKLGRGDYKRYIENYKENIRRLAKAGVKTIIYTDISRDGTLAGVNVEATAKLARESGVAVVASGGVKSIADIEALKPYEKAGIEGVIVGKSIYMGTLDLAEAIEIAAKEG